MSNQRAIAMTSENLAPTTGVERPPEVGDASLPAGAELMREFLAHSPFVGHLGMRLEAIHPDAARISMPYRRELATMADIVHGGAITSLVDTAAMAAAWSIVAVGQAPHGSAVGLTADFLGPAPAAELTAAPTSSPRG